MTSECIYTGNKRKKKENILSLRIRNPGLQRYTECSLPVNKATIGIVRTAVPVPAHLVIQTVNRLILALKKYANSLFIHENVGQMGSSQCCGSMTFWGGSGFGSADPCL